MPQTTFTVKIDISDEVKSALDQMQQAIDEVNARIEEVLAAVHGREIYASLEAACAEVRRGEVILGTAEETTRECENCSHEFDVDDLQIDSDDIALCWDCAQELK